MSHPYPFPLSIWFVSDINSFLIPFLSYFVNHIPFVAHCQTLPWNNDRWCPLLHTYLAMPQCTQRIQTHLSRRRLPAWVQQSLRRSWWYLLQAWRASILLQICFGLGGCYVSLHEALFFRQWENKPEEVLGRPEFLKKKKKRKNDPQVPNAAGTSYYSCHLSPKLFIEKTCSFNISPALVAMCFPESMQDLQLVKVSNLVWKGRSLAAWGPCIALGWTSTFQEILMPRSPMRHQQRNG